MIIRNHPIGWTLAGTPSGICESYMRGVTRRKYIIYEA